MSEQDPAMRHANLSFIFGFIGIVILGIVFGPIAMYYGISAFKRVRDGPQKEQIKKKAVSGVIMGIIAIWGWMILPAIILYISFVGPL